MISLVNYAGWGQGGYFIELIVPDKYRYRRYYGTDNRTVALCSVHSELVRDGIIPQDTPKPQGNKHALGNRLLNNLGRDEEANKWVRIVSVADRLKKMREKKKLSVEDVVAKTGIAAAVILALESGSLEREVFSWATLVKLACGLGNDTSDLL